MFRKNFDTIIQSNRNYHFKKSGNKTRSLDILLEEIKNRQEIREQLKLVKNKKFASNSDNERIGCMKFSNYKLEVNPISDNNGELESLTTTNIRISNLPLNIDEKELVKKFGWFGSLASVKVMWPWSEEERIRGFNVAFVAFMVRNDAEKAMTSLQGILLSDQRLKISWGKPVQIPLKPFWSSFEHYDEINRTEVSLDSNIRVNHYVNKCTREVQYHKRGVAIPPPLSLKSK
jgi:U2-associated protein SR140